MRRPPLRDAAGGALQSRRAGGAPAPISEGDRIKGDRIKGDRIKGNRIKGNRIKGNRIKGD